MASRTRKKNPIAEHLPLINKYLGKHEKSQEIVELKEMMNTASRAGAGGTKAGLVGIRPRGLKYANDVNDYFTKGKYKAPDRPFSKPLGEPEDGSRKAVDANVVAYIPRNYCTDCDRNDRPAGDKAGGAINFSTWTEQRPDLGVNPQQVIVSFLCQECVEKQRANFRDPGKELLTATVTGVKSQRDKNNAERLVRCRKNLEGYIRHLRLTGHWEIYVDGRKD